MVPQETSYANFFGGNPNMAHGQGAPQNNIMMPAIGTVAQIDPMTGQPTQANVIVPAVTNDTFPLPSQQLISTSLVQMPGMSAAPQIGFGPLGGVAPMGMPAGPQTTRENKPTPEDKDDKYFFQPPKTGYERTHHFTAGLDGHDPGSTDFEAEDLKKRLFREQLEGQIDEVKSRRARSRDEKHRDDYNDEMKAKAESDKQYQAHLDSVEESKKYINGDGPPGAGGGGGPKPAGGNMMAGEDDPEDMYGWWYGMGKEKKKFHGKDG